MFAFVFICHLINEMVTRSVCSQYFTTFVEPVSPPTNRLQSQGPTAEDAKNAEDFHPGSVHSAYSAVNTGVCNIKYKNLINELSREIDL